MVHTSRPISENGFHRRLRRAFVGCGAVGSTVGSGRTASLAPGIARLSPRKWEAPVPAQKEETRTCHAIARRRGMRMRVPKKRKAARREALAGQAVSKLRGVKTHGASPQCIGPFLLCCSKERRNAKGDCNFSLSLAAFSTQRGCLCRFPTRVPPAPPVLATHVQGRPRGLEQLFRGEGHASRIFQSVTDGSHEACHD